MSRAVMDATEMAALLSVLARANIDDYTRVKEVDGEQTIDYVPGANTLAIASLKRGTRGMEVKLFDRLKAMEMLAKLQGYYTEPDAAGAGPDLSSLSTQELLTALREDGE